MPYNPRTGEEAKSTDPTTWATRDEAETWAAFTNRGGVGIVLLQINGSDCCLCGIDLDTCRDPNTETFQDWAREVIDRFATYTEVSPSGTGAKLFFTHAVANIPAIEKLFDGKGGRQFKNGGGEHCPAIEIYRAGRYFTVTDESIGQTDILRQVSLADLEWLIREAGPRFAHKESQKGGSGNDQSRSGKAFRKGAALKAAGYSYDAMRDALLADADPEIAEWARTKGLASGERELHRIYDNAKAALSPDFIRGDEKQILRGHPDNIRTAIEHLSVSLRQNEFSNMTEIHGLAGYGPELTDAGAIRLRFLIGSAYYFLPPVDLFQDVLTDIAHLNKYHPVRDFLDSITWDGNPRIDNWLRDYAGAEDTPFNQAIGRIFLIAAVRRVRQPGVKFDTMLVFESPTQGKNKSSAMRLLAIREEWFTDNLPLGADPKEVIEQISGIWIVEFAELDGMATRERERITAFLSRQVDKARPAYGRRRETVKRQFVACGTTNDTEYLPRDERRMWPVRVDLFSLDRLSKNVEQLWAEAAHYEAEGENITLQQDLWPVAEEVRAERLFENPYQATLAEHFSNATFVTSNEAWNRLAIPEERRKKASRDVGQAMLRLGFTRKQCSRDGVPEGCKRNARYYTRDL